MTPRVCCIFNIAPAYRRAIFTLMDQAPGMDVDFLVGDHSTDGIALMNTSTLEGFAGTLRNRYTTSGKLTWQRGAVCRAFARRYDCYVLTGNAGIRSNWVVALMARLTGRKVILWSHGLYGNESRLSRLKNMTYMRLAGHLLLYGDRAKKLIVEQGFDPSKIEVIYNSLDYDKQVELRSRAGDSSFIRNYFGNNDPVLTFVGRLTTVKRIDMIIQILNRTDTNLILIGDGPARSELEALAAKCGVTDRVWFYGECYDQSMIATMLHHSAAVVSPGNVGLTAIHALSAGTPVVTHSDPTAQMPEFEAITPGVTGSLFERGNLSDMLRAIEPWLRVTPDQREATREACYHTIDTRYNPHLQIETLRRMVLNSES